MKLSSCEPRTLATEMSKTVQNIKKHTVEDVLRLIHDRRPQKVTVETQARSDMFDP